MVTIHQALKMSVEKLEGRAGTPLLDAQLLLAHILKVDRLYIIVNKDRLLTEEEFTEYNKLVEKRLKGVPVQYIINNQEFMGLDFYVEEGVLIPRPDTEILVEKILSFTEDTNIYKIVDIGTGSGAISVSLAKYIKNSFIYSIDISEKALRVGRKNAKKNEVISKIQFLQGSLFQPLEELDLNGKIDIIASNPPYIPTRDIDGLQIEVSKYEPREALDGGEDGLDFYRSIINEAPKYLKEGGRIALEVGHDQAREVAKLIKDKKCYNNIEITKDLAGIERVVTAVKKVTVNGEGKSSHS